MELTFKLDLDTAAKASQGGRITTGVYKVEIVQAYVSKTTNGNNLLDLELRSENGEVGFINRICIDEKWTSGSENLDYKRWQELAAACQMQSLTTFATKRNTGAGEVDAVGIRELIGKVVQVAVYEEHDVYNNEEKVTLKLQNTFLADGRSIAEAQAKKPAERIKKIAERLTPYYTKEYKAWKAGGATPAATPVAPAMEAPALEPIQEADTDALFG